MNARPSPPVARFASQAELCETVAGDLAQRLRSAVAARGVGRIALSGGRTPAPLYAALGRADLAWDKVRVTLVDERWVPPSDENSNARLVRESLTAGRPNEGIHFLPMWREGASPEDAAARFDGAFASAFDPLDVAILGMGDDGHTASLFPHSPALAAALDPAGAATCIVVPAGQPMPPQPRLSLTLPAILRARRIVLLLTGEGKQAVLEQALAGDDVAAMPVRALFQAKGAALDIAWAP